jgi:berberine-like enzyme
VLRFYRRWIREAPAELTTIVKLARAPALPAIPARLHGRPVVIISCCYAGPVAAGARVLRPLRAVGAPLLDLIAPRPYPENQTLNDPTVPHGWYYYWQSAETGELSDDLIGALTEHTRRITSPRSYTLIFQLGGAVAEVGENATAYSHRHAAHNININAVWLPGDPGAERHIDWARGLFTAIVPHQRGVYVNFLSDEGPERVRAAYGPEKFARLQAVKGAYDPQNVFALNQNIPPPPVEIQLQPMHE